MYKVKFVKPSVNDVILFKWFKDKTKAEVFAGSLGDNLVGISYA